MTLIKTKRVYEAYDPGDGVRILVDRLWPRGIKKETLKYDFWEKDIEPSNALRQWFHEDQTARWEGFEARYLQELQKSEGVKAFVEKIRPYPIVTLLYAAKDTAHNQVVVLKPFLEALLK